MAAERECSGVAAKENVVTLTGQVAHYAEKSAAEEAAMGVYGVKAVANDIQVELFGIGRRTDQDIVQAALSALDRDFEVPTEKVKVVVKDGHVILEGNVDWQYQKDAAKRCVQYLMGVTAVSNLIAIEPKVKWADVQAEIKNAFRRSADLDARRIGVDTYAGTVTLNGTVSSWAERDEAVTAPWGAPGVTSVNDQLAVAY